VSWLPRGGPLHLPPGRRQLKAYTTKQVDYFAIYLLAEDIWYIFPAKRLIGQNVVMLSPHAEGSLHERCEEAWKLLDSRKTNSMRAVEAATRKIPAQTRSGGNPHFS
jgi:hypothetical protein